MYIKDLHVDVELDSTALTAIRGGSSMLAGELPELPTFGGDWTKFNADVKGYVDNAKLGAPAYDSVARPEAPHIAIPEIAVPVTL